MKSLLVELIEATVHKCSKKGVFEMLEELVRKQQHWNTTSDNMTNILSGCNLTNMSADVRPKNCVKKLPIFLLEWS